jgi:hypothetical protein
VKRALWGLLAAGVVAGLAAFVALRRERHSIPCGYRGPVAVVYRHPRGGDVSRSWTGTYSLQVGSDGVARLAEGPPWQPYLRLTVIERCEPERERQAARLGFGSTNLGARFLEWMSYVIEGEGAEAADPQPLVDRVVGEVESQSAP